MYQEDFEAPFLAASSDFYAKEAQAYMAGADCPEYLRRAERRLAEESERCRAYMADSTEAKIVGVVENELIREQVRGSSIRSTAVPVVPYYGLDQA